MKGKILAFMLSAVLIFSTFAGCSQTGNDSQVESTDSSQLPNQSEEVPVYQTDDTIMFGMWIGVPGTLPVFDEEGNLVSMGNPIPDDKFRQYYQEIKDAGFSVADVGYYGVNYESNVRALKMAEEVGLKHFIYDADLLSILSSRSKSDEQIIREIKVLYAEYLESPAFAGIRVRDEPSYSEIPMYEHMCELWNQISPDTIFYMNLFPSGASDSVLGGTYANYVKQYCKYIDTDYISYDHYVLNSKNGKNTVTADFLYNLVELQKNAEGRDCWTIVQSIKYGNSKRELTSDADCGFQAYSALACGYKGISWFCFWSPSPFDGATYFGEGAYDRLGNKTPTYDYIKNTQLEIRKFEDIYLSFDWQGVFCNIGKENSNGKLKAFTLIEDSCISSDRVKSVESQQDTVIGVFKDKDNRDGFMVVNYTEPSAGLQNKVKLQFNDCTRVIIVKDGEDRVIDVKNGIVEFTQKAGDGTFIIPLK